jgi:hypothetical protein
MVLLGDLAQVDARFIPFRDNANPAKAQKSFSTHPLVLLGDKAQVEA